MKLHKSPYPILIEMAVLFLVISCSVKDMEIREEPMLLMVTSGHSGVTFTNSIVENDHYNLFDYEYVYNGGGIAITDVNKDGLPDLFFTGNLVSNRLYLNKGGFQFEDITESSGLTSDRWCAGVTIVDINNDGFEDIYVSVAGNKEVSDTRNLFYINQQDNTYIESAEKYGIDDAALTTQAAFFDYDKDGDMDMYLLNFGNEKWEKNFIYPKITDGSGSGADKFYRNNGNGSFSNITKAAGVLVEGYGLGLSIFDINEDGYPDVYVSNDYLDDDLIYVNDQKGAFVESAVDYLKHTSNFAMGNDIADINNDGRNDILVVDMLPEYNEREKLFAGATNYDKVQLRLKNGYIPAHMRNTLQLNQGNGKFSEIGQLAGIHNTDWSWAPLLADFDNDGFKDVFITNGYRKEITSMDFSMFVNVSMSKEDQKLKLNSSEEVYRKKFLELVHDLEETKLENYIFKNNGDLTFEKMSKEWGINLKSFSNGAAYADLDGDGDLDLVVNNVNDEAFIYNNQSNSLIGSNYLKVNIAGSDNNKLGFGTEVQIFYNNHTQVVQYYPNHGFQSSISGAVHFGLGMTDNVDSLIVKWSDGRSETLKNIPPNSVVSLDYANSKSEQPTEHINNYLLTEIKNPKQIGYKHKENLFVDFKVTPLLPHRYSQNGPAIAVGDIDNNGFEDFVIGGSKGMATQTFLQSNDGQFTRKELNTDVSREDMGILLFDADNDGDQDLYVVSGGSEEYAGGIYYLDRFYRNDGRGNLNQENEAIPRINTSGSCVTASDFDKDGDLDLFIGGRVVPGNYPVPANSYLLINEGGSFVDGTAKNAPTLGKCGMVTAALWTDFNNDTWIDLIVVGEWMPITFFQNTAGKLENVTKDSGMSYTNGWWNSIASGDFDNDGDIDYIAGNLGMNSRYKASPQEPVTVYANDYDKNGTLDAILNCYVNGISYPVHSRDELGGQLPFVKKKFPKYADYAQATIHDIVSEKDLAQAYQVNSYCMKSGYIENLGDGRFKMNALPILAQSAPLFGIRPFDVNEDGNLDVLLVGNSYATEVELGAYDSFIGLYLQGDGKGNFLEVGSRDSGFDVEGDAKAFAIIMSGGKQNLLVSQNNDELKLFSPTEMKRSALIRLKPDDKWLDLEFSDGRKIRKEFYYGDSYLTQSSRTVYIPDDATNITFTSGTGSKRTIDKELIQ